MPCEHYKRGCHVRAECCQQWVACRLCHNAQFTDHEIDRHAIKAMRCNACQTEQPCAQTCMQCHASMASYFCKTCNLFDDDSEQKQIFHCDGCGICRVGGRDNFFHCATCCGCYPHSLQDKHKCLEGSMHRECAICLEVTFASLESVHVLPCGHVLHGGCWEEYIRHGHYRCPSCRTRMFWSSAGATSDDDRDENDEEEGEDEEDDDDDDDVEMEEDDGEDDSEDSDESGHEDDDDGSESDENVQQSNDELVTDVPSSPAPPVTTNTANGVAQRLVTAIYDALVSSSSNGSEQDTRRRRASQ